MSSPRAIASHGSQAIHPHLTRNLSFDPVKAFAPVIDLATTPTLLVVHPSVPAKNVKQLVDLARKRPGEVYYSSAGRGSNLHLTTELFASLYPKRKVARFLAELKPVQDDLGHLNDVGRARDLLGALAKRSPQKAAAETVVTRLEARVAAADKRARKHVARLRDAKGFW